MLFTSRGKSFSQISEQHALKKLVAEVRNSTMLTVTFPTFISEVHQSIPYLIQGLGGFGTPGGVDFIHTDLHRNSLVLFRLLQSREMTFRSKEADFG